MVPLTSAMHSRCTRDALPMHREDIGNTSPMSSRCIADIFPMYSRSLIYMWLSPTPEIIIQWLDFLTDHYIIVSAYTSTVLLLHRECIGRTSWSFAKDVGATSGEHRRCLQDAFRISFHKNTSWVHRDNFNAALNFYWHLGDTI